MINRKCPFAILGVRRRCRVWNAFPLLLLFVLASQCALFLIHAASDITSDNELFYATQSRDIVDFIHHVDTTRINPKRLPEHSPFLLVTIVCSAPEHFEARNAIRKTWGRFLNQRNDSVVYFLLGSTEDDELQNAISAEATRSGDLIQESSFIDSYLNLTLKTVALLKWVLKNAPTAKYVLKIDDDMFLQPSNLIRYLQKSKTPLFAGYLYSDVAPIRDPTSKWYLPQIWYDEPTLPPFVSGTCYVISADVISQLYDTALTTQFINLEDVFLSGLVASRKLKMALTHHPGFHRNRPMLLDTCMLLGLVTIHEVLPKELEDLWRKMAYVSATDCEGSLYVSFVKKLYEWTS